MTLLLISTGSIVFLLLLVGVGIGLWYYSKSKQQKQEKAEKEHQQGKRVENKGSSSIKDVEAGGFIHLSNAGPEMKDLDVQVIARHTYREEGDEWYELEGNSGEGKVWVEWEDDDELKISLVTDKMKLQDIGLTPEELEKISKSDDGKVEYDRKEYHFEESGKAEFLKNGGEANAERVKYWDFSTEDEKFFLGVELWGDNDYRAYLSVPIEERQISIYSTQETTE